MSEEIRVSEKQPYEGKATQKQKQLIWELGFDDQDIIDELGKKQASELIDQLVVIQTQRADKVHLIKNIKQGFIAFIIVGIVVFWLLK
jgi:hypothetical protein